MLWLYLSAVDLVLGVVLAWMVGSGWWKNGSQRCWAKTNRSWGEIRRRGRG